jgi:periplasmic protein CpxP/Spy
MEKPAMKSMLAKCAAPLLVTTMLVAAPAWAQSTSSDTSQGSPSATSAPSATGSRHATTAPKSPAQTTSTVMRRPGESMENLVDRRITELHTKLQITPAQGQKWDQFAQVMRDNAKAMDQLYADRAQKLSSMTAVDNMQSFQTIEQARMQGMQKLVPAFQTVYDSLSDQQKQAADALFRSQSAKAQAHEPAPARQG